MKHIKQYSWVYFGLFLLFYTLAGHLFPDLVAIIATISFWGFLALLAYTIYYWIRYWIYVHQQKR